MGSDHSNTDKLYIRYVKVQQWGGMLLVLIIDQELGLYQYDFIYTIGLTKSPSLDRRSQMQKLKITLQDSPVQQDQATMSAGGKKRNTKPLMIRKRKI